MDKPQYLAHKFIGRTLKILISAGYNRDNMKQINIHLLPDTAAATERQVQV